MFTLCVFTMCVCVPIRQHLLDVGKLADAAVMGSKVVKVITGNHVKQANDKCHIYMNVICLSFMSQMVGILRKSEPHR